MLKTWVTLGNISCVLLNLFKRLIFVMFKDSSPSQCSHSYHSYFFFSSPITAASHFNFCSLALSAYFVSYVYSVGKSLFMGRLRIALIFFILTIACFISESLLGNTFGNFPKVSRVSHRCWEHGGTLQNLMSLSHYLLFFLGIISWKGASRFNGGAVSDGGLHF